MEKIVAAMTIRNIDEATKCRLRVRAAMRGRSMEDEARDILKSALSIEEAQTRDLGSAIHQRFRALHVKLPNLARDPIRPPVDFGE